MLSHDFKESKENKVELVCDEQAFKIIFDWVESAYTIILIEMGSVMALYELADYLGLDGIAKKCFTYFRDKFTIEYLPVVLPQVTKTTKLMTSGALIAFICRHFLKIANSFTELNDNIRKIFWLYYPIETIEYICGLDLMINSEIQVFNAIIRWVDFKIDNRKCHLKGLFKLIRWCHLNEGDFSKIKENELFKSSGFEPKLCSPRKAGCECTYNRAKQNCFVMIEKFEESTDLRVKVLDNNFDQLISQVIKKDASIASNFFHDEHVSDILFDSGRRVIRIDWKQNKYNWIPPLESYDELQRRIARSAKYGGGLIDAPELEDHYGDRSLLLESAETFDLICFEGIRWYQYSMPNYEIYKRYTPQLKCQATLANNKIYLLTNKSILYEISKTCYLEFHQTWRYYLLDKDFSFDNILFTSSPAGDKINLIHKYTREFLSFDVNTKEKSKGLMVFFSAGQIDSNPLLTFTSAFLPLNIIRTCLNSSFSSNK